MKGSIVKRIGVRGLRYSCVWWTGGKQQWKGGFVRRKDAEQYLNAQVRRVHDGTYSPVIPARMEILFQAWDDDAVEGGVKGGTLKRSTANSYRSMVRVHFVPAFGDVRSDQLSEALISKWVREQMDDIAEGTISPKTFNNLLNLLSAILAWARQSAHRYLSQDPLVNIERLPKATIECSFLEPNQIARLLKAATTQEETILIMLGVYAGLRRGELCAVRWEDFDFGDGTTGRLWIRRAISAGTVTTPKTKNSVRMIDLPGSVVTQLATYRAKTPTTEYLFQTSEGTPIDPDNLGKRIFVPLVRRAQLPGIGLHALRHTYASLLISHGESIKYVSRQLGHASIQITADTYGHLFRETSIAAMGRLDERMAQVETARLALPADEPELPTHIM